MGKACLVRCSWLLSQGPSGEDFSREYSSSRGTFSITHAYKELLSYSKLHFNHPRHRDPGKRARSWCARDVCSLSYRIPSKPHATKTKHQALQHKLRPAGHPFPRRDVLQASRALLPPSPSESRRTAWPRVTVPPCSSIIPAQQNCSTALGGLQNPVGFAPDLPGERATGEGAHSPLAH